MRNTQGFTFLELIISIGVLVLLVSLGLASLFQSRNVREMTATGHNVLSVVRQAQAHTIAAKENSQWGVRLEADRFILFRGATYAGSPFTQIHPLPAYLEIANITLAGGGVEIVFNRLDGRTNQAGSFEVRAKASLSTTFPIAVDSAGQAYQSGASLPVGGGRIVDVRHRAFTLGWSIKSSLTLTLTFANPPGADVVYPIVMAPYFDAGKTKFDWSGTMAVGGENQVLRIHTISLSDTNTVLSVDRDCRYNTKQVTIMIDTSTIATFAADCRTVTIGPFGGTMTEP